MIKAPARLRNERAARLWPPVLGLGLSVAGFGVSAYLTFEHYTASSTLTCPAGGGAIDCLKVTTSSYAYMFGVPVAVLGMGFFALMAVLQTPRGWATSARSVRVGRPAWAAIGVGTALWLIYTELFRIDALCLWCTAAHLVALAIFVVTALGATAALEE